MSSQPERQFKYYDLILGAFVTVLLCANLIAPAKLWEFAGIKFGAGVLFFPISYLFGDILTEVYGYKRSRRVVWAGFAALAFASFMSWTVVNLPPAAGWAGQDSVELLFGSTWRITVGSMVAYFCGEFMNSFVLAKMKVATNGRHLWMRTIGSTIVGEAVDSMIFYPIAFFGLWPTDILIQVIVAQYAMKVLWEVVATPVTYRVVAWLKRVENEDYFDRHTKFTPFSLKV
jgi:uncharacterized integral membrane protein (TIGR00697 family)